MPEVFQRAIAQMIEDLDSTLWYSKDEYLLRLKKLLDRARKYNLKLNKDKCFIRTSEMKFIGHTLSASGLKPDEEREG